MNVLDPNNQQNQLAEEQKNLQSAGTPAAGTPMQTPTAQTNVGTTANKPAAQTTGQSNAASAGGKGSGTYTNLQAYQKANQGATQNISDAVQKAQNIGAQKIGQQIQQKQSEFQRQVDENRQRLDQAGQFIDQTVSGAGQEMDDTAFNRFQNLLSGQEQYQAATPDFSQLENQISSFSIPNQGLDRQNARMELLRRTFGGNERYTTGQRALDDFLVAGSQEARQIMAEAPQRAAQNLQNQLAAARTASEQERALLGQEGQSLQTRAQESVDAAQQSLLDQLEARKQGIADELGIAPQLKEAVASGNVPQELLDQLGLEDNRLYGVDVNEFLTAAPTLEGIATQEDLARAQALAKLEGTEQDIFLDPTQIGTFQDTEQNQIQALKDAVAARRGEYMSESEQLRNLLGELDENYDNILGLMPDISDYGALDQGYSGRFWEQQKEHAAANRSRSATFNTDLNRRAGELGISQDLVQLLRPYIEQQSGFINYGQTLGNPYRAEEGQGVGIGNMYRDLGLDVGTDYGNWENRYNLVDPDRLKTLLTDALSGIQGQYDYDNVLGPVSAKDGAVKSTRMEALRKLLGE